MVSTRVTPEAVSEAPSSRASDRELQFHNVTLTRNTKLPRPLQPQPRSFGLPLLSSSLCNSFLFISCKRLYHHGPFAA